MLSIYNIIPRGRTIMIIVFTIQILWFYLYTLKRIKIVRVNVNVYTSTYNIYGWGDLLPHSTIGLYKETIIHLYLRDVQHTDFSF